MINIDSYSKSNKMQNAAFVQLKNPDTDELSVTKDGEKVGFELFSIQSKEFKRAMRLTADIALTKKEQEKHKKVSDWINEGTKPSLENLDFLDECEDKITKRMQRVFAMVIKRLHHIELSDKDAESIGVKINKDNSVKVDVENIHNLFIALPDLSSQIGDAIADRQNFINA